MSNPVRKKLVIVGDGACGKTSLLIRFCRDEFNENYVPTVFETYVADITFRNKTVRLTFARQIFDFLQKFPKKKKKKASKRRSCLNSTDTFISSNTNCNSNNADTSDTYVLLIAYQSTVNSSDIILI